MFRLSKICVPVILALLAMPAAAGAQTSVDAAPLTSEAISQARARADALIAAAGAQAYFINVTKDGTPTVQHLASGMTCSFTDERYDRISLFPAQGGLKPGDDVGCNSRLGEIDISSYASRYAHAINERVVLEDSIRAIRNRWPDARPQEDAPSTAVTDGGSAPLAGDFLVKVDGRDMLTLVFVAHRGEWSFKGRTTGPADDPTVNVVGALTFALGMPGGGDAARIDGVN